MKILLFSLLVLLSEHSLATTCYSNCEEKFPKWYQGPDRLRCNAEKNAACFTASGLPAATRLPEFDGEFAEYSRRLKSKFLEGGYVVSRRADGSAMHQGDSLLWTSLAMASLSCADAAPLRRALTASIERNGGRIIRFDPLPPNYKGNETSRDAEVGALFGFVAHAARCPEAIPDLKRAWQAHHRFVEKTGKLHEGSNPNFYINPSLQYVWDLVSHHFLGTAKPSDESRHFFETGVIASTTTIKKREDACYPVHLSTLLLVTTARLGGAVNHLTRREFCHESRGMELPLTEWYCERGNPRAYLQSFRANEWEYRHQRCPRWESPDVDPGEQSPAVDYLMMKMLAELPR